MSNLGNQYISSSYQSVLNVGTGSGDFISSTLKPITDGYGTQTPLKLSTTNVEISGNISLTGSLVSSIIPAVSNSIDLGSPTKPFRHLYVGSGSVYLDDHPILSLDTPGTDTTIAAPPSGTVQLLNDVIFSSQEGLGYEGAPGFTIVGGGTQFQSQTRYSGDTISHHTGSIQYTNYWVNNVNQITGATSLELELFKDNLKLATIENSRHLPTYEDSEYTVTSYYQGTGSYNGTIKHDYINQINNKFASTGLGNDNVYLSAGNIVSSSFVPKTEMIVYNDYIYAHNPTASFYLTGSKLEVSGSVVATSGFTGSLQGTASFASNANSASYASTSLSASYAQDSDVANSALSAISADTLAGTGSAVFATTGSNTFNGSQTISGSLNVTGSITALSASITYLQTIYQTSSVIFTSGSNILGDEASDVQTLNGTVNVPLGNLNVTGATTASAGFFGNLQGTASYASNALSASQAQNAVSASHSVNSDSSISSSFAQNAVSSSHSLNADNAISASQAQNAVSASQAQNAVSSSHSTYAANAGLLNNTGSGVFATTGSNQFYGKQTINVRDPFNTGLSIVSGSGPQFQQIYFSTPEYGGNSQPTVFLDGINSYWQSSGNMFFENSPGGGGSGSMNFTTNGDQVFRTNGSSKAISFLNGNGIIDVSGSQFQVKTNDGIKVTNPADGTSYYNVQVETGSFKKIAMNMFTEKAFIQSSGDMFFFNTWDQNSSGSMYFNSPNQIYLNATSSVYISGSNAIDLRAAQLSATASLRVSGSNHNVIGDINITGSLNVSGSANKIVGNTSITGSLGLSGSTTMTGPLRLFSSNSYAGTVQPAAYVTESAAQFMSNVYFAQAVGIQATLGAAQTGSIVVSGSNNIFFNPNRTSTTGQGTYGYVGGANNILNTIPTLNTASVYRPTFNNNIALGAFNFRHTSGSLTTPAYNANYNAGTFTANFDSGSLAASANIIVGSVTLAHSSSQAIAQQSFNNNIVNGTTQFIVNYTSSIVNASNNNFAGATNGIDNYFHNGVTGSNTLTFNRNILMGQGNIVHISGSTSGSARAIGDSFFGGFFNEISSSAVLSNSGSISATLVFGNQLKVNGNSLLNTGGSTFVGRFNDTGSLSRTQDIVFAVGTGTSAVTRRTGLYVTSGSLVGISGSLDVIGNSTITGSLDVTGSVTIANAGNLNMYGHRMFNVGGFQTNVIQSGSANVSQSVDFEITDLSYGVSITSGSRLTYDHAGVYSTTFSAQLLADTGADTVYMWLKKNGTNVAESATKVDLGNNEESVLTLNFLNEVNAGDYIEVAWQSENGDAVLWASGSGGNVPSIPSVIVTSTQVR